MKKISLLLLLIVMLQLQVCQAAEEDDIIVVKLSTESQLIPLYLTIFANVNSGFDDAYLKKLEAVLSFDLNYNGMTQVVPHNKENEKIASQYTFDQIDDLNSWKKANVFYVIKVKVQDKKMALRMLSANSQSSKKADDITLTGDLVQDRKQMHKVADTIHKALFNTEGIATTHFIYTIKKLVNGKPIGEVWEADYDGGNPRQVTKENSLCVTPTYIPPKQGFKTNSFFYVCYRTGQPKIFIGNLNDGKSQRLTYLNGNQLMPAISRQRDKVAFINDVTGNPDLFFVPFSPEAGALGKPQQIFSTHKATQGTPTFSPDGERIAFISNKDGSPRIYVIKIPSPGSNIKDIKAQLITKHGKESTGPAWSPDGSKLAYSSSTNGVRQIWIYDFNTNQEKQLTQGPGHKENPTWAPNSLHLIFNSATQNGSELYLVNLNQPEATKISSGSGEKRFPSWEPR